MPLLRPSVCAASVMPFVRDPLTQSRTAASSEASSTSHSATAVFWPTVLPRFSAQRSELFARSVFRTASPSVSAIVFPPRCVFSGSLPGSRTERNGAERGAAIRTAAAPAVTALQSLWRGIASGDGLSILHHRLVFLGSVVLHTFRCYLHLMSSVSTLGPSCSSLS